MPEARHRFQYLRKPNGFTDYRYTPLSEDDAPIYLKFILRFVVVDYGRQMGHNTEEFIRVLHLIQRKHEDLRVYNPGMLAQGVKQRIGVFHKPSRRIELRHAAFVHHQDAVVVEDSVDAVCNGEHRRVRERFSNRRLNEAVRFGVDGGGSLVENQDFGGFPQDRSSQTDELTLADAKRRNSDNGFSHYKYK